MGILFLKSDSDCDKMTPMNEKDFKTEYVNARGQWIDRYFSNLNPMQRKAVMATNGPVLILAGAGSGKTTVLIQRIMNLLLFGSASDSDRIPDDADETALDALRSGSPNATAYAVLDPVPAWKILAITFTNKAAEELKTRLESGLGEKADDIWACTFHSACVRILRRHAELLGYGNSFTIYDTSDSQSLVKRILRDWNLDDKVYDPRSILGEISRAKDAKLLPEQYASAASASGDFRKKQVAELYREYSRRMFAANAMDFDDLILNTVLLLEQNDDVRNYWQCRFSHIMVDEYQDTNRLQFELVSLLSELHRNLCVVGDDDQSIYRFRGATIENILSFEQQFPGCRTVRLEQNYRSTGHILTAANNVIKHNQERKGKELWTGSEDGEPVEVVTALNEYDEAAQIAASILSDYGKGMQWKDHAVLYRMNAQSSQFEFAFKRTGIPYRVIGGARFFDRTEIKDILSYLCVVSDPNDELRLIRILNVPARGIGDRSIETARSIALRDGIPLFHVLEHADSYAELTRPALKMRQFASMIRTLQDEVSDSAVCFDRVIERTGYLQMLELSKDEKDLSRAENVRELKSSILSYQAESGDMSLAGYLTSIALFTDLDSMDRDEDSVVMMTVHSAKGLEFPAVYVVGLEEGIFPGQRSIGNDAEMEEERRLCYVAFTRAKRKLVLTHARQRMLFGRTSSNPISRFVLESEVLDRSGESENQDASAYRSGRFGVSNPRGGGYSSSGRNSEPNKDRHSLPLSGQSKKDPYPVLELEVGSRIHHQAFGNGTVTLLKPMGGDHLMEIHFDDEKTGSKKLMLKAASKFIRLL